MPADPMIGQTLGSQYRIDERLDTGQFGTVYRATRTKTNTSYAIKVLPSQVARDTDAIKMLENEVGALVRVKHRNVCRVWDFSVDSPIPYIVMEFVEGKTLAQALLVERRTCGTNFDEERAVRIARQAAQGLKACHDANVTHGDLSWNNIMFSEDDQVHLLDFGLARIGGPVDTHDVSHGLGTLPFTAPELLDHTANYPNAKTDIWSLGVLLYTMLAGRLPFDHEIHGLLVYEILNTEPAGLEAEDEISSGLVQVVSKALSKKPEDRFEDVDDFLAALDEVHNRIVAVTYTRDQLRREAGDSWHALAKGNLFFDACSLVDSAFVLDDAESPLRRRRENAARAYNWATSLPSPGQSVSRARTTSLELMRVVIEIAREVYERNRSGDDLDWNALGTSAQDSVIRTHGHEIHQRVLGLSRSLSAVEPEPMQFAQVFFRLIRSSAELPINSCFAASQAAATCEVYVTSDIGWKDQNAADEFRINCDSTVLFHVENVEPD